MTDLSLYFYTGSEPPKPADRANPRPPLPVSSIKDWSTKEGYVADENLIKAVNVAITLGRPLLLTGEPGTGKSDLAKSVAYNLGLDDPLEFIVKSETESRDLFYSFDAVGRFNAPKGNAAENLTHFISYRALGEAILRANEPETVKAYRRKGTEHDKACRSVVLIDEVDKAPRDVPNDILSEIDRLEFEVPELSLQTGQPVKISAPKQFRPIVIITSNLEKSLPDAFMRRCVYYHLPFPTEQHLHKIVESRLGARYRDNSEFVESAIKVFNRLREEKIRLNGKRPATAELLDWLYVLLHSLPPDAPLPKTVADHPRFQDSVLCTLLKNQADQARAKDLILGWTEPAPSSHG